MFSNRFKTLVFLENNMDEKYGDFEELNDGVQNQTSGDVVPTRIRKPRHGEFIGIILQRLGGNRMEVHSTDGKKRNCRVPGRFSRSLWLRPRDVVLIKPWEFDDAKADVIFKYDSSAVNQLRKRGILNNIKDEF